MQGTWIYAPYVWTWLRLRVASLTHSFSVFGPGTTRLSKATTEGVPVAPQQLSSTANQLARFSTQLLAHLGWKPWCKVSLCVSPAWSPSLFSLKSAFIWKPQTRWPKGQVSYLPSHDVFVLCICGSVYLDLTYPSQFTSLHPHPGASITECLFFSYFQYRLCRNSFWLL